MRRRSKTRVVWLGLLLLLGCSGEDVPVHGGTATGGASTDPSGSADAPSNTSEAVLPACAGKGAFCYEQPVGAVCECPQGLTCVGDAFLHVGDCQECDCPPETTCYADAVGGYFCNPNDTHPDSDSTATATGDSTTAGETTATSTGESTTAVTSTSSG